MHRHITYYTLLTVCQSGFYERISSNKFLSSSPWVYAGIAKRGGELFGGLGELHGAKRLATSVVAKRLLGRFGGMLPQKKKFKWCNLERFEAHFHIFFTLNKSKIFIFLYKNNDKL